MDMPILTRAGNAPLQQTCQQIGTPSSPRHVLPWLGGRVCPACRASRCDESTCRVERMAASSAEAATAAAARAWRAPRLTMVSLNARSSCTSGPATQMPTCEKRCSCIAGKTGVSSIATCGCLLLCRHSTETSSLHVQIQICQSLVLVCGRTETNTQRPSMTS